MRVQFGVSGKPGTKGSTRAFPRVKKDGTIGVVVTSDNRKLGVWTDAVAWAARAAMRRERCAMTVEPVSVALVFYVRQPQRPRHHLFPVAKPDLDKLSRAVLDALTGVVYHDDAQVVSMTASKHYASEPPVVEGVIVTVESLVVGDASDPAQ